MENHEWRASDDAMNGSRGQRAVISSGLAAFIRDAYDIKEEIRLTDLGGSSCLNASFDARGRRYVARVYRPYVGAGRARGIGAVRRALSEGGLPCPGILPDKAGAFFREYEGRIVEVEEWVEHDGMMDTLARVQRALPLLGKMHALLEGVHVGDEGAFPRFANYIAPEKVLEMTERGCRRLGGWKSSAYHQRLIAPSLELAERTSFRAPAGLQLVHGDYWDSNVLFLEGSVSGVLDFDFMGARPRIDDLALTLYFASLRFKHDFSFGEWTAILRKLVKAYESGLEPPLTDREHAALPAAVARQPLWSIGGWVALLDDDALAYAHASDMLEPVEWALTLVQNVDAL